MGDRQFVISSLPSGLAAFAEVNGDYAKEIKCGSDFKIDSLNRNPPASGELAPRTKQRCKISVLVAATDEAAAIASPNLAIVAQASVNSFNNAARNSKIEKAEAELVLVGTLITTLNYTGNRKDDYDEVRIDSQVTSTQGLLKADIVVWLTEASWGDVGGYGEFSTLASNAYAILNINLATASSLGFAYEVGHLFNLRHSGDQVAGYNHAIKIGSKKSVVYEFVEPKVPYFSSPLVYVNGQPFGRYNRENNAQAIFDRACPVAQYFPDPPVDLFVSMKHPFGACEYETVGASSIVYDGPNGVLHHLWEYSYDYVTWQTHPSNTEAAAIQVSNYPNFTAPGVYVRLTVTSANNNDSETFTKIIEAYDESSSQCGGGGGGQYLLTPPRLGSDDATVAFDLISSTANGINLAFYNDGKYAPAKVKVVDLVGRMLAQGEKAADESYLTISDFNLQPGVFLIVVESDGKIDSKLFEIH